MCFVTCEIPEWSMSSSFAPVLKRCGSDRQRSSCEWKRCKPAARLNELSNDILVSIVSRLSLKEAVRTSVLCRNWRNLWKYTIGTLDFHYSEGSYAISEFKCLNSLVSSKLLLDKRLNSNKRYKFMDSVNHILSLHQGSTIEEFKVFVESCGPMSEEYIQNWVEFALGKRVKRLKLYFCYGVKRGCFSLTRPLLRKFKLSLPSLTILSLKNVEVSSEVIDYVMLKCFALEELHVESCYSLLMLKLPGPLPRLKSLKIICCDFLKWMDIHAINIVSFTYHGLDIPVSFKTAPQLVNASLCGYYGSYFVQNIGYYSSYIKNADSLELQLVKRKEYLNDEQVPQLPVFENLRVLKLDLGGFSEENTYNICAAFLKKCPLLTKLSLTVFPRFDGSQLMDGRTKRSSECLHSQLKVVEIPKFRGIYGVPEFIYAILSDLPSLDQVHLHPIRTSLNDPFPSINDLIKKLQMRNPKVALIKVY